MSAVSARTPGFSLAKVAVLAICLQCASFSPIASGAEWAALKALEANGARVGAMALDLSKSPAHESLNPNTRLTPASISKLVIAAAALETWPADKTFETRVTSGAPLRDGRVEGDLLLHGDGDATLNNRDLWALAGQVRAAGVREVRGGVTALPSFGPLGCDNIDRCEALSSSDTAYNVPLSSLGVDYGTWCVDVQPTQPGQPALLRACGGAALPVIVEGKISTVAARGKETFWISRETDNGRDRLKVGGNIAPGESQEVFRAMSDPALGAAQLLRQMLIELGVRIQGDASVRHDLPPTAGIPLARTRGLALREQLGRMLRYSNNYIADLLTLTVAAARLPNPPTQLAEASAVLISQFPRGMVPGGTGPRLYSGSGLTPENEVSAGEMVAMLETQYRNSATFPAFYGGLTVPAQAPFAFVRGGSRAWRDRVALKTGTLNDPHSVCAVAGYLRKKDGGWMAFAILVNGSDKKRRVPLYKAMEAIRADIDDLLTRY